MSEVAGRRKRCTQRVALVVVLGWTLAADSAFGGEHWPRFRGPNGTGVSDEKGFPTQWSDDAYAWKVQLKGLGHSSPCVWGDSLFLTSALADGSKRFLTSYSTSTGDERWTRDIETEAEEVHDLNSYASPTPTTDGERVYLSFASGHQFYLAAFAFDGAPAWSVDLGKFENGPNHGYGTSPIVHGDLVILSFSQEKNSAVLALDRVTGAPRWRTPREGRLTCHSTPFLIEKKGGGHDLFVSAGDGILSLDARSGHLNWREDVLGSRVVASPVYTHGLVFATSGGQGQGRALAAARMHHEGDPAARIVWTRKRELPYVPTPLAFGDHLYLWNDKGVVVCLEAKTGEEAWKQRVGGNFSGSPIWLEGRLYCVSREGEVVVLKAGPEYELLGRTSLGEGSHGTPAVAGGRMFLRGFQHLFCLQATR